MSKKNTAINTEAGTGVVSFEPGKPMALLSILQRRGSERIPIMLQAQLTDVEALELSAALVTWAAERITEDGAVKGGD